MRTHLINPGEFSPRALLRPKAERTPQKSRHTNIWRNSIGGERAAVKGKRIVSGGKCS